MIKKELFTTNTKWEKEVGYSRAVKVGKHIFVSGTKAVDQSGDVVGKGNVYQQTKFIFQKIENVLTEAGASLNDVVRTRMYVVILKSMNKSEKLTANILRILNRLQL